MTVGHSLVCIRRRLCKRIILKASLDKDCFFFIIHIAVEYFDITKNSVFYLICYDLTNIVEFLYLELKAGRGGESAES